MSKKKTSKTTSDKKKLYCAMVLDESGSMMHLRQSTIEEGNKWIADQAKEGPEDILVVATFDGGRTPSVKFIRDGIELSKVPELGIHDYSPNGSTPLYDAIGQTIAYIENDPRSEGCGIVMVVMTDGGENASREHSKVSIDAKLKEKEDAGWSILYLGANQNAKEVAMAAGFSPSYSVNYDASSAFGNARAYTATSNTVSALRSAYGKGLSAQNMVATASATLHNSLDIENAGYVATVTGTTSPVTGTTKNV